MSEAPQDVAEQVWRAWWMQDIDSAPYHALFYTPDGMPRLSTAYLVRRITDALTRCEAQTRVRTEAQAWEAAATLAETHPQRDQCACPKEIAAALRCQGANTQ